MCYPRWIISFTCILNISKRSPFPEDEALATFHYIIQIILRWGHLIFGLYIIVKWCKYKTKIWFFKNYQIIVVGKNANYQLLMHEKRVGHRVKFELDKQLILFQLKKVSILIYHLREIKRKTSVYINTVSMHLTILCLAKNFN